VENPIQEIIHKSKEQNQNYLAHIRHTLMKTYGWIPLKEFKQMAIPEMVDLLDEINEDIRREQKMLKKSKSKKK